MSFRQGSSDLVTILSSDLEQMRKQQQRTAEILRDVDAIQGSVASQIGAAVGALGLRAGYIHRTTNAAALADNTSTLLSWEASTRNDDDAWSSTVNPSRVRPLPGIYEFWGQWTSGNVAHNKLQSDLRQNAAGAAAGGTSITVVRIGRNVGRGTAPFATAPIVIGSDDYVELFVLVEGSVGTVPPIGTIEETWIAWRRVG